MIFFSIIQALNGKQICQTLRSMTMDLNIQANPHTPTHNPNRAQIISGIALAYYSKHDNILQINMITCANE